MARVVIFGSRDVTDYDIVSSVIKRTHLYKHGMIDHIISGMARGADLMGKRFAEENGIECICMPADWDKYGKRAGYLRNEQMAEIATHAIGFWDGESRGTKHMVDICKKAGIPMAVYNTTTRVVDIYSGASPERSEG